MNRDCAVLFLVFNRPEPTARVFERIRNARPSRLYLASDGPRIGRSAEAKLVCETREVVSRVDWECDVRTLYRKENLGCKRAVSEAINWFFSHEEMGIILEDDCLPSNDFFDFCSTMLWRYRSDARIGQVCGSSFEVGIPEGSYSFSKYGPIWGWASWRRAWSFYEVEMESWPAMSSKKGMEQAYQNPKERAVKMKLGESLYAGEVDTWDYQWGFAKTFNSMLSVVPAVNLIENIGFDQDATHTAGGASPFPPAGGFTGWLDPPFVLANVQYDNLYAERAFSGHNALLHILKKLSDLVKRMIGKDN